MNLEIQGANGWNDVLTGYLIIQVTWHSKVYRWGSERTGQTKGLKHCCITLFRLRWSEGKISLPLCTTILEKLWVRKEALAILGTNRETFLLIFERVTILSPNKGYSNCSSNTNVLLCHRYGRQAAPESLNISKICQHKHTCWVLGWSFHLNACKWDREIKHARYKLKHSFKCHHICHVTPLTIQ